MPKLPPRWFIRSAWKAHRALLRVTADRVGLSVPKPGRRFGMLRLHTVGRRSGRDRAVVLGYIPDGDRFVTLAMNGWDPAEPAWWLNLQAQPEATVDLVGGAREVTASRATGAERERLWAALHDYAGYGDLDGFATRRGRETAVVVLAPRS
jgi:deazaflavin-dependent oxidoreductase (nitroreductase family)